MSVVRRRPLCVPGLENRVLNCCSLMKRCQIKRAYYKDFPSTQRRVDLSSSGSSGAVVRLHRMDQKNCTVPSSINLNFHVLWSLDRVKETFRLADAINKYYGC